VDLTNAKLIRGTILREHFERDCFLCKPDQRLIVTENNRLRVMAGLGPITSRYLLIAASTHVRSFADLYLEDETIGQTVEKLRRKLDHDGRTLLMTEHGRVPVCNEDGDPHESHCFHAHFLLFSTERDIETVASTFFMESSTFDNLSLALRYASTQESYYLLSPNSKKHVVFHGPLNVTRQFFRSIVAVMEDQGEKPDWREHPNWEIALKLAETERDALRYDDATD
jgi:diadenosine tetraphosphate (Ap4A) HIT family hydrolase